MEWQSVTAFCVLAFFIVFILTFKDNVGRLIDRIKSVSQAGISFTGSQEPREENSTGWSFSEVMAQPITATELSRENLIKSRLDDFKTDEERITALTRSLAVTRIAHEFSEIANNIFGTQLNLLNHISSAPDAVSMRYANAQFEDAKTKFPELHENRNTEGWLAYLRHNELIITDGERVDLTQHGKDFLKYLIDTRKNYFRYG